MLEICVPPGIGDISWVLQKLYSWNDRPPIKMLISPDGHRRLLPFLNLIDWIEEKEYCSILSTAEILKDNGPQELRGLKDGRITLQCNTHLESGRHLDYWLPTLETSQTYPVNLKWTEESDTKLKRIIGEKSIGIYPSSFISELSYKGLGGWDRSVWLSLCKQLEVLYPNHNLVLIGAEWDRDMIDYLYVRLNARTKKLCVGEDISFALSVIQDLDYFYSFPSGLGILADIFGTPTTMFMSNHLKKMIGTWGNPITIKNGQYIVELFPDTHWDALRNISQWMNKVKELV